MNRICSVCKIGKNLEEFYRSNKEKLGREYRCKQCTHEKYKNYRNRKGKEWNEKIKLAQKKKIQENPDYYKICYRKYKGKELAADYRERFRDRDKKKVRAHRIINYHVKRGNIVKPEKCEICHRIPSRLSSHHHDYDQPKNVVWVCGSCHFLLDNERRKNEL